MLSDLERFRPRQYSAEEYVRGILSGDRMLLGKAITLIESQKPEHMALAQSVIEGCLPHSGRSLRVGITGTPGVGKSTFIEALGSYLTESRQRRVAVLAVDPSSSQSRGSILGDKTRMARLAAQPSAFIRPSPAGQTLGGVARKTRETIILCEAAGFDTVLVETVGVGQSEIAVQSMTDFFLLLLLPNAGDELQGIKRGVMEMADLVLINKADGDALPAARLARRQCNNALHLFPPRPKGWSPQTLLCSALNAQGIEAVWENVLAYEQSLRANGYWQKQRDQQALFWLQDAIRQGLLDRMENDPYYAALRDQVQGHSLSPFRAAELWLQSVFSPPQNEQTL